MAEEGRGALTSKMNSNIYDNNAKEIDPAMVRAVVAALIESQFNLVDDFLKDANYSSGVTLEQQLNNVSIVSNYGVIQDVNVGESLKTYTTTGIITEAHGQQRSGQDFLLRMSFSVDISNKRIIPVLTTNSLDYNANNDICTPVIKRINSTSIDLGLRQVSDNAQSLNIEIILL